MLRKEEEGLKSQRYWLPLPSWQKGDRDSSEINSGCGCHPPSCSSWNPWPPHFPMYLSTLFFLWWLFLGLPGCLSAFVSQLQRARAGMIWAGGIPSGTPNTGCGCKACALPLVPRWNLMGFPGNANSSREREVAAALTRLMWCPWISLFWVCITVIPGNSISQQATPGQDSSASPAGTPRSAGITSFPFTWDQEHIRHWDESFTDQTLPTSNSHGTHRPEQNLC